jgi:hypothetical protein
MSINAAPVSLQLRIGQSRSMSNPVIQQLPALIGVCVGAVATYATTGLAERARWRREQVARWDQARMHAYAEYGNAVKKKYHLACRIAAGRGFPYAVQPLAPTTEAIDALGEAEGERAQAWEPVLLLGDPETVASARAWHQLVWRLEWYARGQVTAADQWEPLMEDIDTARDRFYDCARGDLGIKGGAVPTPSWPSWMEEIAADDGEAT